MKPMADQLIDAWNSHDCAQLEPLYSPDYEGFDVAQASPQVGIEGICNALKTYWTAFPDLQFTLEASVAEGDAVSLFWRAEGTHKGPILHIPATGRAVVIRGAAFHRMRDDKVVHCTYIWDTAGLLRNLGLLPELAS